MPTIRPPRPSAGTPPCPRCAGAAVRALRTVDRNRAVSDRRFEYAICGECGVVWLPEIPEDLAAYYPRDYHASLEPVDLSAAIAAEALRVELVTRHVKHGRMTEIGPSQGVFAAAAKAAGFDVTALEMDADCCEHLERVVGVRAIHTSTPARALATLEPSRAVVMWHVIEHLPDPWDVLAAVAEHLEPGGVLALATPNPRSLQARLLRGHWSHIDAPRHLSLIPLDALRAAAAELGLRLQRATTTDAVGLSLNRLGWERSLLRPPAMRDSPRGAYPIGRVLAAIARPWERRAMRGAAYTAVFRKDG